MFNYQYLLSWRIFLFIISIFKSSSIQMKFALKIFDLLELMVIISWNKQFKAKQFVNAINIPYLLYRNNNFWNLFILCSLIDDNYRFSSNLNNIQIELFSYLREAKWFIQVFVLFFETVSLSISQSSFCQWTRWIASKILFWHAVDIL